MSSFGVFRKFVIEEIKRYENPYPYLAGLVLNATRNIGNVSVAHRARVRGKSGYTLRKLISILANATTAYSVKPLRVTSIIGFISVFLGLIFGIDVVLTKFRYPTVPLGYTSIMTVLLFIGGFLMISLGLIGEYVGRIYVSLNRSPQYVIKSTTNIKQ